jgi:hypothetical protein
MMTTDHQPHNLNLLDNTSRTRLIVRHLGKNSRMISLKHSQLIWFKITQHWRNVPLAIENSMRKLLKNMSKYARMYLLKRGRRST